MNSGTLVVLAALWILIILEQRKKKRIIATVVNRRKKRKNKEATQMKELAKRFIGKECLIYTVTSENNSVKGTITDVTDGGLIVEYKGELQAINLEYITKIQDWPRNKKGKKKEVF